jgi:hypothetical protein
MPKTRGKVHTQQDLNPADGITDAVLQEIHSSPTLLSDMEDATFAPFMFRVEKGLPFGAARFADDMAKHYAWFRSAVECELADAAVIIVQGSDAARLLPTLTRGLTTCHKAGTKTLLGYVPYVACVDGDDHLFAFFHKDTETVAFVLAQDASLGRHATQIIANLGKIHTFPPAAARRRET